MAKLGRQAEQSLRGKRNSWYSGGGYPVCGRELEGDIALTLPHPKPLACNPRGIIPIPDLIGDQSGLLQIRYYGPKIPLHLEYCTK
jgi:hypothetical protein